MKAFYCEKCSKRLPAPEAAEGRTITCPYCRKITRLVFTETEDAPGASPAADPSAGASAGGPVSSEEEAGLLSSAESPASDVDATTGTLTSSASQVDFVDDAFALSAETLVEIERKEVFEAMVKLHPNFEPNPFGYSFPLEKTKPDQDQDADDEEEENEGSPVDSSYDVDDLIKGVEKPDGGF